MSINQTQSVSFSPQIQNISGLDPETALMAVQSTRANLLEDQMKSQLDDVKMRNEKIAKLNDALSAARSLSARFKSEAKAGDKISDIVKKELKDDLKELHKSVRNRAHELLNGAAPNTNEEKAFMNNKNRSSIAILGPANKLPGYSAGKEKLESTPGKTSAMNQDLHQKAAAAGVTFDMNNKGELEKAIENMKSMIDTESNSQQMDMLRLQSLTNKRNEAFDLMTNFIKKMQDNRSSITGNMR